MCRSVTVLQKGLEHLNGQVNKYSLKMVRINWNCAEKICIVLGCTFVILLVVMSYTQTVVAQILVVTAQSLFAASTLANMLGPLVYEWFIISVIFSIILFLTLILFYRKEIQGDAATKHLCFPSHISSMEQKSSSTLDGKFSCFYMTSICFLIYCCAFFSEARFCTCLPHLWMIVSGHSKLKMIFVV